MTIKKKNKQKNYTIKHHKKTDIDIINTKYAEYKKGRKTLKTGVLKINTPDLVNLHKTATNTINFLQSSTTDTTTDNQEKVCIIIPYRNRTSHLDRFLKHFIKTDYDIYVINQNNADKFNRGLLLNVGFHIAAKSPKKYKRYIFHDVDSYPDNNLIKYYSAELNNNVHFASNNYKYSFAEFLGGVVGFTKEDFIKINGFPNNFFGWGGEDDAFYNRCVLNGIQIWRPQTGNYILEDHEPPTKQEYNSNKKENILADLKSWRNNGVKQLAELYINIYEIYGDETEILNILKYYESNSATPKTPKINTKIISNIGEHATLLKDWKPAAATAPTVRFFNIDYLAKHTATTDIIESADYVTKAIKRKLDDFKKQNITVHQHKQNPLIISVIPPLIYWQEIQDKIVDTYKPPKKYKSQPPAITFENPEFENLVEQKFKKCYKNKLSKINLQNTLSFIYNTYGEFIYIRIRNGKIENSYNIYNTNVAVDWYKDLKYKNAPIHQNVLQLITDRGAAYNTIKRPQYITANGCLLSLEEYNYYEGNPVSYIKGFIEMINATIAHFGHANIPECDLIINRKDFPYIDKTRGYAYEHLSQPDTTAQKDYKITKWFPVLSQSAADNNLDISVPTSDEWERVKNINSAELHTMTIPTTPTWQDKKNAAVFRGKSTGCGNNADENPRIKLAEIGKKHPQLMDVGLVALTNRITAFNRRVELTSYPQYKHLLSSFKAFDAQSKYKYVFNVEGNAAAYRFPTEFKHNSVLINIESKYKMWFEPLLKNGEHYIEISSDNFMGKHGTQEVVDKIKWLQKHDADAEQIAQNGYDFFEQKLCRKSICNYWFFVMLYCNKYAATATTK